jgi:Na+-transporting NADH:ubiquinone oxidoreductase subunit NqrD
LTEAEKIALAVTTRFETGISFGCAVSAVDGIESAAPALPSA